MSMQKNRSRFWVTLRVYTMALTLALSQTGCAAWFERYRNDPLGALSQDIGYIQLALNLAKTAFEGWAINNPNEATNVRPQFTQITGAVDAGLASAQDGIRLAKELRGPAPDSTVLLREAQSAIMNVNRFLANLRGTSPDGTARAATPLMRQALEMTERAATIHF